MRRQKVSVQKSRCEVRLPVDLNEKLDKIALKAGVTRTSLIIAAVEQFIYGEETQIGVETIHERVAVLTVGQDRLHGEMLEIRAYLDVLGQTMCASKGTFDAFLASVEKVKSELVETAE